MGSDYGCAVLLRECQQGHSQCFSDRFAQNSCTVLRQNGCSFVTKRQKFYHYWACYWRERYNMEEAPLFTYTTMRRTVVQWSSVYYLSILRLLLSVYYSAFHCTSLYFIRRATRQQTTDAPWLWLIIGMEAGRVPVVLYCRGGELCQKMLEK